MKILLTAAYDGTDYSGWQRQDNAVSVQGCMEDSLSQLYNTPVTVMGASRTDAGVHALGQRVCYLPPTFNIPIEKLPRVINSFLPDGIAIQAAGYVNDEFHPIFDVKRKTYAYSIHCTKMRNPMSCRYNWQLDYHPDIQRMREAAEFVTGRHNFKSFCAAGGSAKTFERTIISLDITEIGDIIKITVTGDGFLYNMVRIITGTLVDVGRGKLAPADMELIIAAKDRGRAGQTAPAQGLTLVSVDYGCDNSRQGEGDSIE